MTKPISLDEISKYKKATLPDAVIECWNNLIAKNWNGSTSIVYQHQIVHLINEVMNATINEIHDNKWLDIEDIYRNEGWKVTYSKPGYNENYNPYFEFTK
jgi:hypothetical protein